MFAKEEIGKILKACVLACIWIMIISCTVFPQLLKKGEYFLIDPFSFETTGKFLLFSLGVYIFDLMIQVVYSIDEHVSKILVIGTLGCITVSVLIIPFAINLESLNKFPVIFVGLAMGTMKAFSLYLSDKTKKVNYQQVNDIEPELIS